MYYETTKDGDTEYWKTRIIAAVNIEVNCFNYFLDIMNIP